MMLSGSATRSLFAVAATLFATTVAGSLAFTPLQAQQPAALVIRLQGDVQVTHGSAAPTPAYVGEQMYAGDGVLPGTGSRAILITRAGSQQIVSERTTIAE